jgi:hypothetical protein
VLTTPHCKKLPCYEQITKPRTWTDSLVQLKQRKRDLQEVGWDGVAWIDMAQDRERWRALVHEVMSLRVP